MISKLLCVVVSAAAALWLPGDPLQAQTEQSSFRADAPTPQPRPPNPPAVITPEMRGDIFMARKMYREAAEAYKEGPKIRPCC